ncbi:MAG: hypothetical protein AAGB51_02355 [Planctomycetota bacterium]
MIVSSQPRALASLGEIQRQHPDLHSEIELAALAIVCELKDGHESNYMFEIGRAGYSVYEIYHPPLKAHFTRDGDDRITINRYFPLVPLG